VTPIRGDLAELKLAGYREAVASASAQGRRPLTAAGAVTVVEASKGPPLGRLAQSPATETEEARTRKTAKESDRDRDEEEEEDKEDAATEGASKRKKKSDDGDERQRKKKEKSGRRRRRKPKTGEEGAIVEKERKKKEEEEEEARGKATTRAQKRRRKMEGMSMEQKRAFLEDEVNKAQRRAAKLVQAGELDPNDEGATTEEDDEYEEQEPDDPADQRGADEDGPVGGGGKYGKNVVAFLGSFRSEGPVCKRLVRSIKHVATSYLLCDTHHPEDKDDGSTRRTITRYMAKRGIPGKVIARPWVNFGVSKTHVLRRARVYRATRTARYFAWTDFDEVLLMNATPLQKSAAPGSAEFAKAGEAARYPTREFMRGLVAQMDALPHVNVFYVMTH